ncbi:MAG: 6-phosphogluconolactonase [Myxococcales bacterium]|nr:6-phosphogluconolactonase [Myxococcales bacterium]
MSTPQILVFDDKSYAASTAAVVAQVISECVSQRGVCNLALAGGSTPPPIYKLLSRADLPWAQVHIYFTDERAVPPTDLASNYRMAADSLLEHAPIPPEQIHRMMGESRPADAARRYTQTLQGVSLDVVLLGMGRDGHTASVFPDDPDKLSARGAVPSRSPEPPTERITMSLSVLSRARYAIFLVRGSSKARCVQQVLEGGVVGRLLPAGLVRSDEVLWLLDTGAAAHLRNPR